MIRKLFEFNPELGNNVYVDEMALVSGQVSLGDDVSIWPMAVLRGDVNAIRIGNRTNIQDNTCCHVTHDSQYFPGGHPLVIGDDVTIGHKVTLHGCTIGNHCFVGIDTTILDGAVLANGVMVGAGSLVAPGKHLESGYLYLGRPAVKKRKLTPKEIELIHYNAQHYVKLKNRYLDLAS